MPTLTTTLFSENTTFCLHSTLILTQIRMIKADKNKKNVITKTDKNKINANLSRYRIKNTHDATINAK